MGQVEFDPVEPTEQLGTKNVDLGER